MATSRVRRLLCIRGLHVALTSGLPINHARHLANLNLHHLDHVLLRSLLSCAHATLPLKVVVKAPSNSRRMVKNHTAPLPKRLNVSGHRNCADVGNPSTLFRANPVHHFF